MPKTPVQPQDKFVLRLPDGLRARIREHAEKHGRSMNAEIVLLLEDAFINETYAESMERLAVERQLQAKASVEKRLSDIEAKLEQIIARLDK